MARMKIFNTLEEEAFESPPEFNSWERKRFFSLSLLLKESQASLRTPTNKVCFLNYFGCKPFDEKAQTFTAGEIAPLIRVQLRPKLVLVGIIQLLTRKKIEIPSYNVLAD